MKTSYKTNEAILTLLKKEIGEIFGKKITSAGDCLLLSEDIYAKTSYKVNSNTLRRFFGLVKSGNASSATTLEILLKYCGFSSFDEMISLRNTGGKLENDDFYPNSILNYLIALFNDTPVREYDDKTFSCVVEHTIQLLQRHPELTDKFQRAVAKTKNGQDFYFEQFIGVDVLTSSFGKGLRYYLLEKKTPEAQIFGHALLCLRDFLTENLNGVNEHYNEVMKHELTAGIHPFVWARYYATQLLHANVNKLPIEAILMEAQKAHALIRSTPAKHKHFPYFEYIICPALLLTGHPQEALYYLNYSNNFPARSSGLEKSFYETLSIIKALVFVKTGKKIEAQKIYKQIHPSRFHFQSKKANTLLYVVLGQHLNAQKGQNGQDLAEVIAKTGFTRLHTL